MCSPLPRLAGLGRASQPCRAVAAEAGAPLSSPRPACCVNTPPFHIDISDCLHDGGVVALPTSAANCARRDRASGADVRRVTALRLSCLLLLARTQLGN